MPARENSEFHRENGNSQVVGDDVGGLSIVRGSPADLLHDLFPELQTFPRPFQEINAGNTSEGAVSKNTKAALDGHIFQEAESSRGGCIEVPWDQSRPCLGDLSLLTNDEMDLEVERFGSNGTGMDSKDEEELKRLVGTGSDIHQCPTNITLPGSCSQLISNAEEPEVTGLEGYPAVFPQGWQQLPEVYAGGLFSCHPVQETYSSQHVPSDGPVLCLSQHGDFRDFNTPIYVSNSCPPRNLPTNLYLDKGGFLREPYYCSEDSDMSCVEPYPVGKEGLYAVHSLLDLREPPPHNGRCSEIQGDFLGSHFLYPQGGLYPIQPQYIEDTNPLYDAYNTAESDSTSTYTISRPSSCTRSMSTQGSSLVECYDSPVPLQAHSMQGSSPEWTPPPTPLFVQFHSARKFAGGQVGPLKNSVRPQQSSNEPRHTTPVNSVFISLPGNYPEGESGREQLSTCTRQDNNELLVKLRDQGVSYKEIKKRLNCPEAESTLRGRHRTLTKDKSQRVRKPVWTEGDIRILINCVTSLILSPHNMGEIKGTGCKISARWKHISEQIIRMGGSYKFGPGTCKKKYKELVDNGTAPAIQELEKRRSCRSIVGREERSSARLRGKRKVLRRISKPTCVPE